MTDTMPSGESQSDPDDESGTDTPEAPPEEELDDEAGSTGGAGDDSSGDDSSGDDSSDDDSSDDDSSDRELDKVAGSDPPDPKKLDELDEQIRHARSTADDMLGTDDEPDYHESGEETPAGDETDGDDDDEKPEDDQAITPPG